MIYFILFIHLLIDIWVTSIFGLSEPYCSGHWTSLVMLVVKNPPADAGEVRDSGLIPGSGRSPEGGHGTLWYLSWWISWTEESSRLQSIGLQRVGHDWNELSTYACMQLALYIYKHGIQASHRILAFSFGGLYLKRIAEPHGSVWFSHSVMSNSLQPHGLQHTRLPCPLSAPRVYSNSCPISRWCHPTISSSVDLFSSRLQSFPTSGSFQMNWLYTSGGQSIGISASASNSSNEHPGLIPFRMDWLDLLAVQRTLKSLRQHHSSKASIQCSAL